MTSFRLTIFKVIFVDSLYLFSLLFYNVYFFWFLLVLLLSFHLAITSLILFSFVFAVSDKICKSDSLIWSALLVVLQCFFNLEITCWSESDWNIFIILTRKVGSGKDRLAFEELDLIKAQLFRTADQISSRYWKTTSFIYILSKNNFFNLHLIEKLFICFHLNGDFFIHFNFNEELLYSS